MIKLTPSVLTALIATLFLKSNDVSFSADWLDVVWVLALLVWCVYTVWTYKKRDNGYAVYAFTALVFVLFVCIWWGNFYRPAIVYDFEKSYKVKASLDVMSFMDAGTAYTVYHKISALPFLEKKVGSAINEKVDYINTKPLPQVSLTDSSVIITREMQADTIPIDFDHYLF